MSQIEITQAFELLMSIWHDTNRSWVSGNLSSYFAAAWTKVAEQAMSQTSATEWEHGFNAFVALKEIATVIVQRTTDELQIEDRMAPRTAECGSNNAQALESYQSQLSEIGKHVRYCQLWSKNAYDWMLTNKWLRQITIGPPVRVSASFT